MESGGEEHRLGGVGGRRGRASGEGKAGRRRRRAWGWLACVGGRWVWERARASESGGATEASWPGGGWRALPSCMSSVRPFPTAILAHPLARERDGPPRGERAD